MAKHNTVSTVEARRTFSDLLLEVQYRGERVTITRNGRPVAELVPVEEGAGRKRRAPRAAPAEAAPVAEHQAPPAPGVFRR